MSGLSAPPPNAGPANRKYIEDSRAILAKFGIELQGGKNVVWALNEAHSVAYAKKVYERLGKATTKDDAEAALSKIGDILFDPKQGAKDL